MQNWDEIKTAFFVAKIGTVSGAAEQLGLHHATVIRHVDALEERLKTKLFQRHARGYTPTEAGLELLSVAQETHDQFAQLEGLIKDRSDSVEGELVITSLASAVPYLMPVIKAFQEEHPNITVRFLAGERLFRLEYGEAHVAIRAGRKAPDQADNIVQLLSDVQIALYGSKDYVERYGAPQALDKLDGHRFIGPALGTERAPQDRWLSGKVGSAQYVLRSDDMRVAEAAVEAGIGLGFLLDGIEASKPDLVRVLGPEPEWSSKYWLVTHMDLHRTAKVQAFTRFLKENLRF